MKNIYYIILPLTIFLLTTKCTMTDELQEENIDHLNSVNNATATISVANYLSADQPRSAYPQEKMLLDTNSQSIKTSMMQENWNNKVTQTTRTTWTSSSNLVSWVTGDKIGVYTKPSTGSNNPYTDRDNVQHSVTASGVLTPIDPPIYFTRPYNSSNNTTFYAYYPYSSTASTNSTTINYTLPSDQSSQASLANADIMSAVSAPTNGSSPNIILPFNHRMVLLSFQIKGALSLITSATLTKVQLSGSAITNSGSIDLKTGTVTPTSATFSPFVNTEQSIKLNQYGYVDIIVNPFTVSNNIGNDLLVTLTFRLLSLTLVEIPVTHTTRLVSTGSFAGGTRYTYILTVTLSL